MDTLTEPLDDFAIPTPRNLDELAALFDKARGSDAETLETLAAALSFTRGFTADLSRAAERNERPTFVGSVDALVTAIEAAQPTILALMGPNRDFAEQTTACAARLVSYLALSVGELRERWKSGQIVHACDALVLLQSSIEGAYRYQRMLTRFAGGFVPELAFGVGTGAGVGAHLH